MKSINDDSQLILYSIFRREAMKQSILQDSNNTAALNYKNRSNKKSSASSLLLNCGKRSQNKRKKHRKSQSKLTFAQLINLILFLIFILDLVSGNDEIFTYEEVTLYYPRANIKVSSWFFRFYCW